MEDKDLKNKAELSSLTKTYSENDDDAKGFLQKLGRKMTSWYVNPFGDSQNKFNETVAESIDDTCNSLEELNKKVQTLETKLSTVVQQNDALKSRINRLQQNDVDIIDACISTVQNTSQNVNNYIRKVNPDKRKNASFSDCKEIYDTLYTELANNISVQTKNTKSIDDWGKVYKNTLKKELQNMGLSNAKKIVLVICKSFISNQGLETTSNQAFELYRLLKKSSIYNTKFISIEPTLTRPVLETDIICIPENTAEQFIQAIEPILCIFCGLTPNTMKLDNNTMLLNKSIFYLSGQNPLKDVQPDELKELLYLNDLGLHKYLVQSKMARNTLIENGFHEPELVYPQVNKNKIYPRTRNFNKDNFTIGFVSVPNDKSLLENRGINLLCDIAKTMSKVKFEIAWKYDEVEIPNELKSLENVNISVGKYKTKEFFSKIDCLILPYTTADDNSACNISSIEALKNGIPVICSEVSGIADIINYCSMGEVSAPNCDDMVKAINTVISQYEIYNNIITQKRLDSILDNNIVDIIENEVEHTIKSKPVTLSQLEKTLEDNKKSLVMGYDSFKEYRLKQDKPNQYYIDKFGNEPFNCLNYIESQNVGVILEDRFESAKLKMLDVSCGDNAIVSECIKHGSCTAIDVNEKILKLLSENVKSDTLNTKVCDILNDEIEGRYNAITCFRYLYHFDYATRKLIYSKLSSHLTDSGILIMNVPNLNFELQFRNSSKWKNNTLYETAWTKDSITEELKNNGFKVQYILPLGQGLMNKLPDISKKIPMCWTIGAIKNMGI